MIIQNIPVFLETFFSQNCNENGFFWLDSGNGEYARKQDNDSLVDSLAMGSVGRFAFFGMMPEHSLQYFSSGKLQEHQLPKKNISLEKYCLPYESLQSLEKWAGQYAKIAQKLAVDGSPIPFQAGLVGGFTYEFGYYLHNNYFTSQSLQTFCSQREEEILWQFSVYSAVLAVDLQFQQLHLLGYPHSQAYQCLQQKIECAVEYSQNVSKDFSNRVTQTQFQTQFIWALHCQYGFTQYQQKFHKVKNYLQQGEIYQLNLSQKLHLWLKSSISNQISNDVLQALYLRLRQINPVPFGSFCRLPNGESILSFSPERFFRLTAAEGLLEARPMKGTRSRIDRPNTYHELCDSKKERAELLMITDLLRNDLYHICQSESVQVMGGRPESWPFCIEAYPYVWQQTAVVQGKLKTKFSLDSLTKSKFILQLWQALFPCGSITGAPKMRAMELIRELEEGHRHWYTGNWGYINGNGNMEFNVLIRSFYSAEQGLNYHVGGGLVWDSKPLAEWQELKAKSQFFLQELKLQFALDYDRS